ncbi:MAG: thiamine-phosphate kinase [Endomicrobia bacterium]|nr:thiamine-phosphate kinase [Endomicrobiia bacterium]MCL2507054.1 thiamine-phosphate kinase [Endomicrobiia bacterium]
MKQKNIKILSSIGEFALLDIIKNNYAKTGGKSVSAGIGDDCFCFKNGRKNICVTKDMLVEDVHFKTEWTTPYELGQKAVEVNVSDIASMGRVKPEYIFIGLGLPSGISVDFIKKLYSGIKKSCDKYGVLISGGDTVKSDKIIISVTLVGIGKQNIIRRTGAKSGDLIGVTNTFGDSGAGLDILYRRSADNKFSADEKYLIKRQSLPQARLKEAEKISKYLTSMTDASDGLYVSIGLLTKSADIFLDKIPLSKQLKRVVKNEKRQIDYALFGSEDFELVFTVSQSKAKFIKKLVPEISFIGKITNSGKVRYFYNDKEQKTAYRGYKHF